MYPLVVMSNIHIEIGGLILKKILWKPFLAVIAFALVFTVSLNSTSASNNDDPNFDAKYNALEKSGFYNPETHELLLSEEIAKSYYNFSDEELNEIKDRLASLTDEEINKILEFNGINPNDVEADPNGAHANWFWLIPVGIGIIVAGGIIFSAMYFSHKEKMTLINRCYDKNGNPKVSSNDKAGLKGKTDSGAAERAGGYKFECVK